jgi:hypothetical protein
MNRFHRGYLPNLFQPLIHQGGSLAVLTQRAELLGNVLNGVGSSPEAENPLGEGSAIPTGEPIVIDELSQRVPSRID